MNIHHIGNYLKKNNMCIRVQRDLRGDWSTSLCKETDVPWKACSCPDDSLSLLKAKRLSHLRQFCMFTHMTFLQPHVAFLLYSTLGDRKPWSLVFFTTCGLLEDTTDPLSPPSLQVLTHSQCTGSKKSLPGARLSVLGTQHRQIWTSRWHPIGSLRH